MVCQAPAGGAHACRARSGNQTPRLVGAVVVRSLAAAVPWPRSGTARRQANPNRTSGRPYGGAHDLLGGQIAFQRRGLEHDRENQTCPFNYRRKGLPYRHETGKAQSVWDISRTRASRSARGRSAQTRPRPIMHVALCAHHWPRHSIPAPVRSSGNRPPNQRHPELRLGLGEHSAGNHVNPAPTPLR